MLNPIGLLNETTEHDLQKHIVKIKAVLRIFFSLNTGLPLLDKKKKRVIFCRLYFFKTNMHSVQDSLPSDEQSL